MFKQGIAEIEDWREVYLFVLKKGQIGVFSINR
jgi:hypothetical protein